MKKNIIIFKMNLIINLFALVQNRNIKKFCIINKSESNENQQSIFECSYNNCETEFNFECGHIYCSLNEISCQLFLNSNNNNNTMTIDDRFNLKVY